MSRAADSRTALEAAAGDLLFELRERTPDLLLLFISPHHVPAVEMLLDALGQLLPEATIMGCGAASVIGGGLEVEAEPGLVLGAACLPDVELHPFALSSEEQAALGTDAASWHQRLGLAREEAPHFLLLGDPFSLETEKLLAGLTAAYPDSVAIGGLASGAEGPGESLLIEAGRICKEGVVGLAMTGNIRIDSIVAQGCRPIGQPMFVTRCQGNELLALDGKPPLEVLRTLFESADERERLLFQHSLFVGIQMNPDKAELGRGDFLVRNLLGSSEEAASLYVGAELAERQVLQFQLRDAITAAKDLAQQLQSYAPHAAGARAALLFSCLGRGRHLYGQANYDTNAFLEAVARLPVVGFFGNGEIGPVEGRTALHAYTSVFGVIRTRDESAG